jgi:hypothetical protein
MMPRISQRRSWWGAGAMFGLLGHICRFRNVTALTDRDEGM